MAYKATGKPRGRPKVKEYETLQARVPQELAALVKRYATEHGMIPISELIREGVEWRIGDGDPRGTGMYLAQPTGLSENVYSSNTETALAGELLQEMRALFTRQEAQMQAWVATVDHRLHTLEAQISCNTSDSTPKVVADNASRSVVVEERTAMPFDPATHALGRVCKGGHVYPGTVDQTLYRLPKYVCPECDKLAARERRARKRQAVSVAE